MLIHNFQQVYRKDDDLIALRLSAVQIISRTRVDYLNTHIFVISVQNDVNADNSSFRILAI